MGQGGYDLEDLEWDEAVVTLIQTCRHQSFFVLHCYRGLPLDGLENRQKGPDKNASSVVQDIVGVQRGR